MRNRPLLRFLIVAVVALAAALLLDRAAYTYLSDPGVYDKDWGRMLRTMGFLPFWLLGAVALWLHDRAPAPGAGDVAPRASWRPSRRALLLMLAPTVSGIVGALLQLIIRRERPWAAGGAYVFRPFSDRPLYGGGLAMPSSHAVVAFGAAFALARIFPRTAVVWYLLAVGCALTRVAARAHFLSDVTLGALVAWAVVAWLWRRWGPGRAGRPVPVGPG